MRGTGWIGLPSLTGPGTCICDAYAAQWQLQWQDTHMLRICVCSKVTPPPACPRICFAYACGGAQLFGFARRTRICVAYAKHMRVSCIWGARNLHLVRAQLGGFVALICLGVQISLGPSLSLFPFPPLSPPLFFTTNFFHNRPQGRARAD